MTADKAGSELLRKRIAEGERLAKMAAQAVDVALNELQPLLVGDKQLSTAAVEAAFERLRAARQVVVGLQILLAAELAGEL